MAFTVSTTATAASDDDVKSFFDELVAEISTAVNDGTLEMELTSARALADASVDVDEYTSPVTAPCTFCVSPWTNISSPSFTCSATDLV